MIREVDLKGKDKQLKAPRVGKIGFVFFPSEGKASYIQLSGTAPLKIAWFFSPMLAFPVMHFSCALTHPAEQMRMTKFWSHEQSKKIRDFGRCGSKEYVSTIKVTVSIFGGSNA